MGKLTQTNQFNGGIIKDLHPIMTPNTVLTDCLNGTLITYNGNEFVLQNDMGNYSFTNGSLSRNFVPVGLKEFGGLLYIISYNPLENKVEIGTFPSQQTIWGTSDKKNSTTLSSIKLPSEKTLVPYTSITSDIVLLSKDKDNTFYLSPGDKYILTYTENSEEAKYVDIINWQHLTLYALTDDNKLYNINSYINFKPSNPSELSEDYQPISWEIPGWIAAKFDLNTPLEFSAYFDSSDLNSKKDEDQKYTVTPYGTLKLKTVWDSSIYNEEQLKYIQKNLCYLFHNDKIEDIKQPDEYSIKILTNTKLQYNTIQTIMFANVEQEIKYDYVTPILKVGEQYIVYNQFTSSIKQETYTIDATKIKLGEDYFKYYTDENSVTLYFDYKSYPGILLGYQLYRFTDSDTPTYSQVVFDEEIPTAITEDKQKYYLWSDVDYNGTNIIDITFSTNPSNLNSFDKEDIYVIVFGYLFKNTIKDKTSYEELGKTSKLLYVSDVTNNYYNTTSVFEFTSSEWAEHANLVIGLTAPNIKNLLNSNYNSMVAVQKPGGSEFKTANNFKETADNKEEFYGKAFTEIPSTVDYSGIGYYKVINRYTLQNSQEKLFTLKCPVNQYGDIGRLWKNTKILSISKDTTILDSKGKSYTLSYDSENLYNSNIYFDVSELYKLEVSDYSLVKKIASEYKTISDFETADNGNYLSSRNKVISTSKGNIIIRMGAALLQECYGDYGSISEWVVSIPSDYVMYATFVDNKLYWAFGTGASDLIIKIADGTATDEERDNCLYPRNMGPDFTPGSDSSGYQLIRNHQMSKGDGWTDLGPMSNVARNIQPIWYASWTMDSVRIKNVGDMGETLVGLFVNSTDDARPYYIQNFLGDNNVNNIRALYAAIMYYIRYATRVSDSVLYYPSISVSKIEFSPFTITTLNSKGEISWDYNFTESGNSDLINAIKEIKVTLDDDGTVYGKDILSNTMYLYDQESTQILLESFANDINVIAKGLYDEASNSEDIEAQTFYVIPEYNNETNPIHNLKEFAKLLKSERDRIRIVLDYSYYNDNDVAIKFFRGYSAYVSCAFALNKYFN